MLNQTKLEGKLLLKGGTVYSPENDKLEKRDIIVQDGIFAGMEKSIEASDDMQVIDCEGLVISPGFTDIHVHFREPGYENKETMKTGSEAAIAGGFTAVCTMPNTDPAVDRQEAVQFIRKRQESLLVEIFPVAAATKNRAGVELTEYGEIAAAGAVGFTDDGSPIADSGVMRRALEYSKIVDKPIVQHAEDLQLRAHGLMHEGKVSTSLGLPGIPGISETSVVYRDLQIAEYVKSRLHFQHISLAESVELIRAAKERGVRVTAEVTPHHLMLTDEAVRSFDTNTKVHPPLRTRHDVDVLRQALADGIIDVIATDHAPHALEDKEQTFDLASPGMIGLETALGVSMKALVASKITDLNTVLNRFVVAPRRVMQLPMEFYVENTPANLTIFDPEEEWVFREEHVYSRSKNSPFFGTQLLGRVKAVISRSHFIDFGLRG